MQFVVAPNVTADGHVLPCNNGTPLPTGSPDDLMDDSEPPEPVDAVPGLTEAAKPLFDESLLPPRFDDPADDW